MTAPVKPLLKWPGGKRSLAREILPLIPEHQCYVEAFCGAAAIFLHKPRSTVEVLNDVSGDITGLFRVLQHHPRPFLAELRWVVNSRQNFNDYKRQRGLTDIQRGARFCYLNMLSFGGDSGSYGVQRSSGGGATTNLEHILQRTDALHARLQGVSIENLSWEYCLQLYDAPATFFFLDPPYLGTVQGSYESWKRPQFEALAKALRKLRGRFVLTLNDHPVIRRIFRHWPLKEVSRPRGIKAGVQFRELIFTSTE